MNAGEILIQRGLKQGVQQGIQQGIQQGVQQGMQQGKSQLAAEIARNMLADGIAISKVQAYTGLSKKQLEEIVHPPKSGNSSNKKSTKH